MRRKQDPVVLAAVLLLTLTVLSTAGCGLTDRLTFIRQSAKRGDFEKVAPTYDVSGKQKNKGEPLSAEQLVAASSASFEAGRVDQAKQQAQQAFKLDPQSGDAQTLLAVIAAKSGNAADAGEHYKKALDIAPTNGAYANNYGTWLCGNGQPQESLPWFDKALADPGYPTPTTALANIGACAMQAGQPERADTSWRQALTLDPDLVPALSGLASLQFSRGEYMDARAFAERWLMIAPQDASALRLAMQIEQKQGDNAAAQRYLLRLQAISPDATPVPPAQ